MCRSARSIAVFDRFRKSTQPAKVTPATFGVPERKRPVEDHPGWLAVAAAVVILLPKLPLGNYIIYPFMILTTWFHEMGHGLTAILVGMEFDQLVIFPNGSGYALTYSDPDTSGFTHALVSAGGPLGPAIAGALMILASTKENTRRLALTALGGFILISTAIWVRSIIGWAVLIPMGFAILFIAQKGSENVSRFAVQFLGVHAAISMFGQWDYLFTEGFVGAAGHQVSDTGAMEGYLLLPHWFWAGSIIVIGTLIIGWSLWRVIGRKG